MIFALGARNILTPFLFNSLSYPRGRGRVRDPRVSYSLADGLIVIRGGYEASELSQDSLPNFFGHSCPKFLNGDIYGGGWLKTLVTTVVSII